MILQKHPPDHFDKHLGFVGGLERLTGIVSPSPALFLSEDFVAGSGAA